MKILKSSLRFDDVVMDLIQTICQRQQFDWGLHAICEANSQFHSWSECELDLREMLEIRLLESDEFKTPLGARVKEYCDQPTVPLKDPKRYPDGTHVHLAVSTFFPCDKADEVRGYRRLHEINTDGSLVCLDGAHRLRKWGLVKVQTVKAYITGLE